jgi:hypothetical protein
MGKDLWTAGIFLFGGWAVYLGIMVRLGKWRAPLMYRGFPVLASPGTFLIAIPIGLSFIIIGLEIVFPDKNLTILGLVLFFATIILGFWMPNWLFPKWFQWLMKNYEPVLGQMFEEARQMGIKEWEKHTRTQGGLERWADSVAQKHGWQRLC